MDLRLTPKAGTGATDVFVPTRHYPGGYDAIVTGGHVVSRPQARHLLVVANASGEVRVVVRPHVGGAPGARPAPPATPAGAHLPATGFTPFGPLLAGLILGATALLVKLRNACTQRC
jgi:hypothetical protein